MWPFKRIKYCDVVIPSCVTTVVEAKDYGPELAAKRSMLRTGRGLQRGRNHAVIGPEPKRMIEEQPNVVSIKGEQW